MDLLFSITTGHPADVADALVDPDAVLDDGRRPLSLAAALDRVAVIDVLLDAGAPIDAPDGTDLAYTPLIAAAREGALDAVRRLLRAGADITAAESIGGTALHHAVLAGRVDVVRELLRGGAAVDAVDDNGRTPLVRMAVQVDATEVRHRLDDGTTLPPEFPLHEEYMAITGVLADAGCDLDAMGSDGYSAAHHAAANGTATFLERLLRLGADVENPNAKAYTVLHAACDRGCSAAVAALIAAGASVDRADVYGVTPLHGVAVNGAADVAALLLAAGADTSARVREGFDRIAPGMTAADIATEYGFTDLARLFA